MVNKIPVWVWLIAIGGGGYLAYTFLRKKLNVATDGVADVIANTIIAYDPWLSQPPTQTAGMIVLPGGQLIPTASVQAYVDGPTGQTRVKYGGRIYALAPHNSTGNWPATLVG